MMSRKPFVVTIAAGGNCPGEQCVRGDGRAVRENDYVLKVDAGLGDTGDHPSMGSPVVGTLARLTVPVPSSSTQTSVNVPPTSTATRVVANSSPSQRLADRRRSIALRVALQRSWPG